MKIIIDPEDDIQYMSFYIKGLYDLFGNDDVIFDFHAFKDLPYKERHTRSMRMIVRKGYEEKRFVINANDFYSVNETLYDWCDTYGNVNANFDKTSDCYRGKQVSLCPSFAIKFIPFFRASTQALKGVVTTYRNKRKYLGCWKRTLQRPPLEDYVVAKPKDKYVFHVSTLWKSDEWSQTDQGVNLRRMRFIKACREMGDYVDFEGGLVTAKLDERVKPFEDCLCRRYSNADCLKKTKESAIVFNTPAYWDCHGWKLGEYMALGKAVLTTPLYNDLPAPFIDGVHAHFVNDCSIEELKKNIKYLIDHKGYCDQLGSNLRKYWENYGSPTASLRLLGINR